MLNSSSKNLCCVSEGRVYLATNISDNCTQPLLNELDLLDVFHDEDDEDEMMIWYQQCFGPRDPPSITWQELIIPLLGYG